MAMAGGPAALAQQEGAGRPTSWDLTLGLQQLITDSYLPTDRPASDARRAEAVTTLTSGIRYVRRSGQFQGSLDYGLSGVIYARDGAASNIQHRLAAAGRGEIVPRHLDVNLEASISRQAISALGSPVVDGGATTRNQSEVQTLSLQPVLRGVFGGVVATQLSANASITRVPDTASTSRSRGASLVLSPAAAGRLLAWNLSASRQVSDYDGGRSTTYDQAVAALTARPDADLRVTVRAGVEGSDLGSAERQTDETFGASLEWTPSARTRVLVEGDKRQFGDAHNIAVEHRLHRSVLRYAQSRSLSDGRAAGVNGGTVTAYDLYFELFASQEPDPVARDLLVREFLQRNGIDPRAPLGGGGGFLTNAASIQSRQELSLALNGIRGSIVVSGFRSRTERADALSGATDDLASGPVRQRGISVSVSHRLTPTSSLSASASTHRSRSEGTGQATGVDNVSMSWSTQFGKAGYLSITVRHAEYDEVGNAYSENALSAALSRRF